MSENITQTDSCKIEGFLGVTTQRRKSRCPASLDLIPSGDFFRAIYVATYAFCIDHFVW